MCSICYWTFQKFRCILNYCSLFKLQSLLLCRPILWIWNKIRGCAVVMGNQLTQSWKWRGSNFRDPIQPDPQLKWPPNPKLTWNSGPDPTHRDPLLRDFQLPNIGCQNMLIFDLAVSCWQRWLTFEVALVTAVASKSVIVGVATFDAHDVLPALFSVGDVLLQVVIQLFKRQLRRSARRVYITIGNWILRRVLTTHAESDRVGRRRRMIASSVRLFVCPQHNSKTNYPKVFKHGIGNDLGIS